MVWKFPSRVLSAVLLLLAAVSVSVAILRPVNKPGCSSDYPRPAWLKLPDVTFGDTKVAIGDSRMIGFPVANDNRSKEQPIVEIVSITPTRVVGADVVLEPWVLAGPGSVPGLDLPHDWSTAPNYLKAQAPIQLVSREVKRNRPSIPEQSEVAFVFSATRLSRISEFRGVEVTTSIDGVIQCFHVDFEVLLMPLDEAQNP